MNRRTLYIIGFISMIIDHIEYYFPNVPYYEVWRSIGRIAFPIFAFFLIEGFYHTKNLTAYKLRLLKGTVFLSIINLIQMIINGYLSFEQLFLPNIFFTMLCGLFFIEGYEQLKVGKVKGFLSLMGSITLLLTICEYKEFALFYFVIFTILRNTKIKFLISMIVFGCYCVYINDMIQFFMIFDNFLLCFYNGQLGKPFKQKYLFYYLYIGQFIILSIMKYILTVIS